MVEVEVDREREKAVVLFVEESEELNDNRRWRRIGCI